MKTKEKLIQFLDYKGIKPTKAENMLNWGKGAITKPSSMSIDKLEEFLLLFTELSAEWLLRGEGEMIKDQDAASSHPAIEKEFTVYVDENGFLKMKN